MERHISYHLHLLPTTESALEARAVLEDEELNPQITTLSIRASLKDVDKNINPTWDAPTWGGLDQSSTETAQYRALKSMGCYPSLSSRY
jgi:hypothetical protein